MRVLFVANPTAQSGKNAARVERALEAMRARGWSVELCATEPDGQTVAKVAAALDAGAWDCLVYQGGDGTFREAAMGDLEAAKPIPLGMLPAGTANDQGKSFGIASREGALEENLEVIAAGFVRPIDAGRIRRFDGEAVTHQALFFDSAGFGLQPAILHKRNLDREAVERIPIVRELYRDQAVYFGAAIECYLASFLEDPKMHAHVVADEEVHELDGLLDIIVKNTAVYGGAWVLDRFSEPDDGRMELVPIAGRRDWFSKTLRDLKDLPLWQEHLDELGLEHTEGFDGTRFELTLAPVRGGTVASQLDGEEWVPGTRFDIEVLPRALPLIVREGWRGAWEVGD